MTITNATIYRETLNDAQRVAYPAKLFGLNFPFRIEPTVFAFASRLSEDYKGGLWHFYALSNGGFYMAPDLPETFEVYSENGYEGAMSADAFGLTCCLYTFSHLSFTDNAELAQVCAEQYHLLRDHFASSHDEAKEIHKAID